MNFMNTKQAYDLQSAFKSIYGNQYGLSPELQAAMFQQGVSNLQPQFAGLQKSAVADLNQRGFNSAVPYGNVMSNMNTGYMRALQNLQQGITTQSMQAGENQRLQLFNQLGGLSTQMSLMELQKKLGEKGFMDFLGSLLGQGMNVAGTYAGIKLAQ